MNQYSYSGDPDFSSGYYITDKMVKKYHKKPFGSPTKAGIQGALLGAAGLGGLAFKLNRMPGRLVDDKGTLLKRLVAKRAKSTSLQPYVAVPLKRVGLTGRNIPLRGAMAVGAVLGAAAFGGTKAIANRKEREKLRELMEKNAAESEDRRKKHQAFLQRQRDRTPVVSSALAGAGAGALTAGGYAYPRRLFFKATQAWRHMGFDPKPKNPLGSVIDLTQDAKGTFRLDPKKAKRDYKTYRKALSKWERRGTPPNFKKYLAVGAAAGAGLGVLDMYLKKQMAKKLLEQEFGQER
jgi:hypothetical protein